MQRAGGVDGGVIVNDAELERYSRQIRLPQVGEAGQQRLLDAHVLIIGMGGLGSPASMYLAAAGVGHLVISDFDRVDESNLQRQIVHSHGDIGREKAASARDRLEALNPRTRVDALDYELDGKELAAKVAAVDVVVDCTDNFPSRFALNRACLAAGTPFVSAAAMRWHGQVATFLPQRPDSPCYQCLYPDESVEAATCAAEGVIAPLVGVIGSMQALQTLEILLGASAPLCGRLLLFDAWTMQWQTIKLPRNPDCPACSSRGGG